MKKGGILRYSNNHAFEHTLGLDPRIASKVNRPVQSL